MGVLNNLLKNLISDSKLSSDDRHKYIKNEEFTKKSFTPEEWVIEEQKQTGKKWHGVELWKLSILAQDVYHGLYVDVDKFNILNIHFQSISRKTKRSVQCSVDKNGKLKRGPQGYYSGQWKDSADEFIEKANQKFVFKDDE